MKSVLHALFGIALMLAACACMMTDPVAAQTSGASTSQCEHEHAVNADVVSLDQPLFLNRLGANMLGGMIYALRRDVVATDGGTDLKPGHVQIDPSHRPRPLVLRVRAGDCLHVRFQNLLSTEPLGSPDPAGAPAGSPDRVPHPCGSKEQFGEQTCTREAGLHIYGMSETSRDGALLDGSFVGSNVPSVVPPGGTIEYMMRADAEGVFLMYSEAADTNTAASGGGLGGQLTAGLFGSLVVEPRGAEWFRSQVTKPELDAATLNANRLSDDYALACRAATCELRQPSGEVIAVNKDVDGALHTADGHPLLNYDAVEKLANGSCVPVLRMVDVPYRAVGDACEPAGSSLLTYYGDLTAIVAGPNGGRFSADDTAPPFNRNAVAPNRHEPYREFVEHYHDAFTVAQAFGPLYGNDVNPVLANGADNFAINYGADAIGSKIVANRLGTGPEGGCVECRFEEFFLSSWAAADPAELVGHPDGLKPMPKAPTVPYTPSVTLTDDTVSYPDDPSNVYHSYIGDRVIFRIVHAGQLVTHLHHLHAHQWLHSPNSDTSTYLDSQLISPGSTYTQEIDYDGSGNRNRTVGDAIFHCHFYPHFAAGMWGLWRNHDVFEAGTDLSKDPAKDFTRALPDGELAKGTPIPAVVPMPTLAMAPIPARVKICKVDDDWDGDQLLDASDSCPTVDAAHIRGEAAFVSRADFDAGRNPGYPLFIPGVAGQRAPIPPLSHPADPGPIADGQTKFLDGGLARHLTIAGEVSNDHFNAWDFSKDLDRVTAVQLPEGGTPLEVLAMETHSRCLHPSVTPEGHAAAYLLNGGPRVPGAPYANPSWGSRGTIPCVDLAEPTPSPEAPHKPSRVYKAADVQMDVVFNKLGWHYPQERFETLWEDVAPSVARKRAPEPLFVRANSGETIEFWLTNLVPDYYELDDFQVRTPTDVLGQHIHLVKFDVTSSDGAANGYNYESGALSPDAVREEIAGIRRANGCAADAPVSLRCPQAKPAPAVFGPAPQGQDWTGAETINERWWADPVLDNHGVDRTLRTVFTHDHFGPSTHQQAGLYSGLVIEPKASTWRIPAVADQATGQVSTDVPMGLRDDGGPTSWAADIQTTDPRESYREFAIEFQDIALAYTRDSRPSPQPYPCARLGSAGSGSTGAPSPYVCGSNVQPDATTPVWGWVSQDAAINGGTQANASPQATPVLISAGNGVSNLNYRSEPLPPRTAPAGGARHDPAAPEQDLALGFASIQRADPVENTQPPATAKLWSNVAGSTTTFPGPFPGAEPFDPYTPMMRVYPNDRVQVRVLVGAHEEPHSFAIHGVKWLFEPSDPNSGYVSAQPMGISEHFEMLFRVPPAGAGPRSDYLYQADANVAGISDGLWGLMRAYNQPRADLPPLPGSPGPGVAANAPACPPDANHVAYDVTATTAAQALPGRVLTYNTGDHAAASDPITQPDAILYVPTANLDGSGHLVAGAPVEPLILRAAAGDCIDVTLRNAIDPAETDVGGAPIFNQPKPDTYPVTPKLSYGLYPSARAGLHAPLLEQTVTQSDGSRVGGNPDQTAAPGTSVRYAWYAGRRSIGADGRVNWQPMELGTINLLPPDPVEQPVYGAVGAMVVEPRGAKWTPDAGTLAAATVFAPPRVPFREFVVVWQSAISRTSSPDGQNVRDAVNYRAEPIPWRVGPKATDLANARSNTLFAPAGIPVPIATKVIAWDPQTPIFSAAAGSSVRFRLTNPGGNTLLRLPEIFGHHWQEEPWQADSTRLGHNPLSETMGATFLGASQGLNLLIDDAGGSFGTAGDYLYRNLVVSPGSNAMWGLFRVNPPAPDVLVISSMTPTGGGGAAIAGYVTPSVVDGTYAGSVAVVKTTDGAPALSAPVNPADGTFSLTLASAPSVVTLRSSYGGSAEGAAPPAQTPAVASKLTAEVAAPPSATAPTAPRALLTARGPGQGQGPTQADENRQRGLRDRAAPYLGRTFQAEGAGQ
jgi:hypothetical protein